MTQCYQTIFFNKTTYELVIADSELGKTLRDLIVRAEGVEFAPDKFTKVISKFTGDIVDLTKLSTGCKTFINVFAFPEIPINILECGSNILKMLYKLDRGVLYSDCYRIVRDPALESVRFECRNLNGSEIVAGMAGIERWYEVNAS